MPPPPGKRKRVGTPNGVAGSDFVGGQPGDAAARRRAGDSLLKAFLALYASQKISAKDFAVLNHWADLAGCPGADFAMYAMEPDMKSGAYQDSSGPLRNVAPSLSRRGPLPVPPAPPPPARVVSVSGFPWASGCRIDRFGAILGRFPGRFADSLKSSWSCCPHWRWFPGVPRALRMGVFPGSSGCLLSCPDFRRLLHQTSHVQGDAGPRSPCRAGGGHNSGAVLLAHDCGTRLHVIAIDAAARSVGTRGR